LNFDLVARFYDDLATFVFGKNWQEVQNSAVQFIDEADKTFLVVGGGAGKLLSDLYDKHVVYVELSTRMIQKAEKVHTSSTVKFIGADFLEWNSKEQYDVIVLPFFLDCFLKSDLQKVLGKTIDLMSEDGKLIVTDFQKSSWWRNLLVKVMYRFFWLMTGLKADRLLDIRTQLKSAGFEELEVREFYGGWIFSSMYERADVKPFC
jgi:ubiquinone/menaquinone biosynthesis C-methylase UbiE